MIDVDVVVKLDSVNMWFICFERRRKKNECSIVYDKIIFNRFVWIVIFFDIFFKDIENGFGCFCCSS